MKLRLLIGFGLATLLAACNFFSIGEKDSHNSEGWVRQGEAKLRARDFQGAGDCFRKALSSDSANGEAWRGLGKSISGLYLPWADIVSRIEEIGSDGVEFFMEMPQDQRNRWYQGFWRLDSVYQAWFSYTRLHDIEIPAFDFSDGNSIHICANALALWDLDGNRIIDSADAVAAKLLKYIHESPGGLPEEIREREFDLLVLDSTGRLDTTEVSKLNEFLRRSDSLLVGMDSTLGADSSLVKVAKSTSDYNEQPLSFFRASYGGDDDFDGCLDEEVADGLDNDGDGLVYEDTRLGWRETYWIPASGTRALLVLSDGVRGDRLVDPRTGRGVPGEDSAGTWTYADGTGLLEVHAPMVDPSHERYSSWRWTTVRGDSLVRRRERIGEMTWGLERAKVGCELSGGCWCRIYEELCPHGACHGS